MWSDIVFQSENHNPIIIESQSDPERKEKKTKTIVQFTHKLHLEMQFN